MNFEFGQTEKLPEFENIHLAGANCNHEMAIHFGF